MKALLPIAASCLLVGGGVGYLFGNQNVPEPEKPAANSGKGGASLSGRSGRPSGGAGGSEAPSGRPSSYEEVTALPGQTARLQALIELYSGLSNEEFASEAEKLDKLPFNERILAAYILFGAWAEVSPFDAMEHANSEMGQAGMFVRPTIIQSWSATDPKGAADYYEANKSQFAMMGMFGRGRGGMSSGAGTIAGEWAKQDPEGALAWARSLEGREQSDAMSKTLSQIAVSDPLKASQMTDGLEGRALSDANSAIAREWASKDWAATEAWVNGLPLDQQGDAMGSAIRSLAAEDPALAGSKALQLPDGEARDEAVESVAESMARENPADAVDWVMKNGNEESQRESMRDVMGSWASKDPEAARSWVTEQPEGAVRDAAASAYVMNDHSGNGQDQVAIAETIADERTRGWSVGVATVRWMGQDREAATSYIETTDVISEDAKNRILRRGNGDRD